MKRILVWLMLVMVFSGAGTAQQTSAKDPTRPASLTFSRPAGAPFDLAQQIVMEAYERLGIEVQTLILPQERAIKWADQGYTDGEVARIAKIEARYPNLIRVPIAIEFLDAMAFVKDKDFEVEGWQSLRPYKIGFRIGSKFAERGTQGMNTEAVATYQQAFKQLEAGRNDVVVFSRVEGLSAIKTLRSEGVPLEGITMLEPPIESILGYHFLHKQHLDLIPDITRVLEELEQEGRIKAVWGQYVSELIGP